MRYCRVLVVLATVFAAACVASDATAPTAPLKLVEWGNAGTSGPPEECHDALRASGTANMVANAEICPEDDGGGGGGGEGSCPPNQPGCIVPLRQADSSKVIAALGVQRRIQFSADSIRDACQQIWNTANEMWVSSGIKGGTVDPTVDDDHDGAYYQGLIHLDQDFLDANHSSETIMGLILHEAAHAAGYPAHPTGPGAKDAYGRYIMFPYNIATHPGGGDQCIPWPGTPNP